METIQGGLLHSMDHDAAPTSSWTEEDEDGDTPALSPVVMSMGEGGEDALGASRGHGHPYLTLQDWVTPLTPFHIPHN